MSLKVELSAETQLSLKPFTVRPYRSKRLQGYFSTFGQDNLKVLHDDNVKDALTAQGFHVDENPRSVYRVEKLFQALAGFAPGKVPAPLVDEDLAAGISLAYSCFAKPKDVEPLKVLPLTPETIAMITSNPSGSPGLTAYGCTKAESQTRALERGVQTLKGIKQPEPCLAFKRTQFNDKTRLVWGFPYSMTVLEGLVAYPLIQEFKKGTTPMAFSMASGALGTKLRVASYHNKWAYSLDGSQFDANISGELLHIVFKIWRTWYDLDSVEPVTGVPVRKLFNLLEYYAIHTPIVMPDGNLYLGKDHGQASGSYFTQMNDSAVEVIIAGMVSSKYHLNVSKREVFVLGDDLLFWANRKVDLDDMAKYITEHTGVKMHGTEKSALYKFDEPIHFLGRIWSNGLPTQDVEAIVERMVYPETFRRYSLDPERKRKEVRMLILSYASNYYAGWRIAYKLLDGSDRNIHCGCANLDANTYCYGGGPNQVNPDFLSGLDRYRRKYFGSPTKGDIPITALQFWL